ncbi:putative UDP-N-acetylglucosamine--peptide N-acetylglucosaminyltransferase SPINDLY [Trifolium repens]|jgi:hypothetical protein|nr:putative UDP-N-acetylglucosamine--peptide N-acetylglucosaminyltransferase SPINDLY [Trifolium repens]
MMLLAGAKTIRFRDKVLKKGGIWKDINGTDQNQVTDMIREDQVDILVELTGHTANNKLGMMASWYFSQFCMYTFFLCFSAYIFSYLYFLHNTYVVFLFIFQSLFSLSFFW